VTTKARIESRKKIYRSLCYVLSDRAYQIAWGEFTPADWELFSQMADREGVAPLMYWKLKDSPVSVPPSTFNLLRSTYYQTLAQNTLMYQELERILKALDEAGIPVIVLKGAALAVTVYEDIGLRPMGDLDLLVKEEHLQSALSVMRSIDYVVEPLPYPELNQKIGHDIHLWSKLYENLRVELHWQLVTDADEWFSPSIEWFWKQTENLNQCREKQEIGYVNALTNSYAASILYDSAHLSYQHGIKQSRLLWFFDIHLLINKSIKWRDWERLFEQAYMLRWESALWAILAQVKYLFATALPTGILTALALEGKISSDSSNLYRRKAFRTRTKATIVWELFQLLGYRERVIYSLGMIFPSRVYMLWRYKPDPEWIWPLYYPYRWMMMMKEASFFLYKAIIS
jgi:hypothetical protein